MGPELLGRLVDTDRYPLTEPDGPGRRAAVDAVRADLAGAGCSVLTDFLRPDVLDRLREQGDRVAPLAHYATAVVNAYNTDPDDTLPADHPARITVRRGNAFVARDRIPADFLIQQLYLEPLFQRFVADCFDLPELHPLADPLSGLTVNVVAPGMSHPWHFDLNEFTVSLLTREAESGGVFEYCPRLRSPAEENLADVRSVLLGRGGRFVRRLRLRPGDLQLFQGRYALHRVTEVAGRTARHSAIFAYSGRPGVAGSPARARQLFGRVAAEHRAAEHAVRGDQLLD
jgi:hypothetical protein